MNDRKTKNLLIAATTQISIPTTKDGQNCLIFSDGESLNVICSTKDVCTILKPKLCLTIKLIENF